MMQASELSVLATTVLWAAFAVGVAFGAIAQRTQFCTMGALADVLTMGDWTRMRMWALAAGVAVLGFNAMALVGWIDAADSIYARPRLIWLSHLLGGAMFGVGMVLASGCSSKMLVRIGGGSLKALVVFCVLGLAAYATLRGLTAVWRVGSVDTVAVVWPVPQDLPSLLSYASGLPRAAAIALPAAAVGVGLIAWVLARPEGRRAETWLGGAGIGALVVAGWWVSGRLGHVAEHPATLESAFLATNTRAMESLTFVAPIAYTVDWLILYSDASKHLSIGIVSVVGVVLGSALAALAGGNFHWEGFAGTEDTANHIVGALLMGVGGVTALGCTVGQGLSGLSTLSVGSLIALVGIIGGALAALALPGLARGATGMNPPLAPEDDAPDLERRFGALRRLYGDAGYQRLRALRVAVVGVGGVGSWAAEALARSGVAELVLIDLDHVAESNVNRQLQATSDTLGQAKVLALQARMAAIHPGCAVRPLEAFVEPDNWPALLPQPVDVLIDACDQVRAKLALAAWALQTGTPLVCAGAAGGKQAPQHVAVADLADVTHDPLLASLRQRLRREHAAPRQGPIGLRCVFSRETVRRPAGQDGAVDGSLNCAGYGSSVAVTATFGMTAAAEAIALCLPRGGKTEPI